MPIVTLTGPPTADDPADRAAVTVDIGAGCRLATVTVGRGDDVVDLLAAAPATAGPATTNWGSFPMAPWAGRIRQGVLSTPGDAAEPVRFGRNHLDDDEGGAGVHPPLPPLAGADAAPPEDPAVSARAHAIHGTVFGRPWTIEAHGPSTLTTSCPLGDDADPLALGWPFGGVARQTVTVRPRAVDVTLVVEAGDRPFPATVGWHPWFPKPDRLDFHPSRMYERDDLGLPTGRLVEPTAPPWDDCFVAAGPVTLHYDRSIAPEVHIDADCDHWVVYTKPPHATCVEPQSGPPDAPNLEISPSRPNGGAHLVTPTTPLRRSMTLSW